MGKRFGLYGFGLWCQKRYTIVSVAARGFLNLKAYFIALSN